MSNHDTPLPLSFRADLLSRLMPSLRAGECCSLVGTSGVGKSNLVRFLRRQDVQAAYWGGDRTWVVVADTHSLVYAEQPVEFVVAELMIHRLVLEIESRIGAGELSGWASDLHTRLLAQPSALLAMRYLERICARLCEGCQLQIVFLFDQFEDLWRDADARFFLNLRNLRDQFKYQLAYLVLTREPLRRGRADLPAVEAFWELFDSHTYGLGMYGEADAQEMVRRLELRSGSALDPARRRAAIALSGGHPGLLRAVFWALSRSPALEPEAAALLEVGAVAEECRKLWGDLSESEQRLARLIAGGLAPRQEREATLDGLRLKEIVVGKPPALFSPLFGAYVIRQSGADVAGVVVVPALRQVWLDGQPLEKQLSPLEFGLLAYLARHVGTVCRREDILRELYKEKEQSYSASDERLDTILRRLRDALSEDARNPRYLITHRGVGVQLTHGLLQE